MSEMFKLDEYMKSLQTHKVKKRETLSFNKKQNHQSFYDLCEKIQEKFSESWETESSGFETRLERQKRAIIGYKKEVFYFKEKIRDLLQEEDISNIHVPSWYPDFVEGIFQENWGIAGLAPWINGKDDVLQKSSSAKIIGDRIYFLIEGILVLQPQRITSQRRDQLRRALLLKTPEKRVDSDYHEVYMLDGTRITIYGKGRTKEGQDSIVFRKFFVRDYSFERQVDLKTIPQEAVPIFKSMIHLGFNVAFTGAVRTAKTTFLTTWQSYEDPKLEGVCVETDPEIPFHEIMPKAPILQLVADGEDLKKIVKIIMRSDADYIVLGEARDGVALNTAVKIANKGTRRVKMTFHTSDVVDFCYDVADEIVKIYGGSLYSTILKVAKSFQFVFQFVQLRDKSQKRLNAIFEIQYDGSMNAIVMHQVCKYLPREERWVWSSNLSQGTLDFANLEDYQMTKTLKSQLEKLEEKAPLKEKECKFYPQYTHLQGGQI